VVPLVAVKRGARGSCLLSRDGCIDAPALASRVRATTGAGDAFIAGYMASRSTGADAASATNAGHRVAAKVLVNLGPTTLA